MKENDSTKNRQAPEVYQCSKCGACITSCPVYRQENDEGMSPRAKVQLAKHHAENDLLSTSTRLNKLVNSCLMCGNCTTTCPSGVQHQRLFMRMRSYMASDHGEGWHLRVLYHFLSHEQQLQLVSRFAKLGRNHVLEHLAREFRIGNIPAKRLPKFNKNHFRNQVAEKLSPASESQGTVLYFTGCGTNHVYDQVGHALCNTLGLMGFEVEIPKAQVCCGLPMFIHGNLKNSIKNIQTNIELFNRDDIVAVVTDCATCGSALHKKYSLVLQEMGLDTEFAELLGSKVRDVGEFILDHYQLLEPHLDVKAKRVKVTYHMPCHLRNGLGVKNEVEQLLQLLPHVDYIRARDYDSCCGGAGTFFYDHPEISHKIVSKKVESAKQTGAGLWVTGCPGCNINLSGNIGESEKITVLHLLELIQQGLIKQGD